MQHTPASRNATSTFSLLFLALGACTSAGNKSEDTQSFGGSESTSFPSTSCSDLDLSLSDGISAETEDSTLTATITLGSTPTIDGSGASANGSIVTITEAGTYQIQGSVTGGQLIINTPTNVVLILNGAQITSSTGPALWAQDAEQLDIFLAEGTENSLTDAASSETLTAAAALYSEGDLTLRGPGSLTVTGNYADGIVSKDGLKIENGLISVVAMDDGIRGKDFVKVQGGGISISAGGDGVKADNTTDTELGYIEVEGGILTVEAEGEALDAVTSVAIGGGVLVLTSGEDGVHATTLVSVTGGTSCVSSGDDGIHADSTVTIDDGTVTVLESYEGLEGNLITINGGNIHLSTSDDGINVAGGADNSGNQGGGSSSCDSCLRTINGGYVAVNAQGDGLDSNGSMLITGGTILVNGPSDNGNGPMDIGDGGSSTFLMQGGLLIAAGSSGMAVAPTSTSEQYAVLINLDGTQTAGELFHLETTDGSEIVTFAPLKSYQSVLVSSPELGAGDYAVFLGGSHTGEVLDSLYGEGTYTPGTEYTTFSVSSVVTQVGESGGGPGGGR